MVDTSLAKLAAVSLVVLCAASCASKPEPRQPGIDINLGPFGPRIQVSGLDNDDSTPASVNIDR